MGNMLANVGWSKIIAVAVAFILPFRKNPGMRMTLWAFVFLLLGAMFTAVGLPLLVAFPIVHALHPRPYEVYLGFSRWWTIFQCALFYKTEIKGADNLPATGGCVVVANHQSNVDFMALSLLHRRMIIVSKWDVIMLPFLGIPWSLACGHILVDRKKKDSGRQAIARGVELVKQGYCVFLFPEGTRREGTDGKVQDAKIGAFKMAKDAGVPIVPITIRGANYIMPNGKFELNTGTVQMEIHPAFDSKMFELEELKTTVMSKIQSKMTKGD